MFELFYLGGPLFMGILTIELLIILAFSVVQAIRIKSGKLGERAVEQHRFGYIKSLGLFSLITGILGQLIGLYSAFDAIEEMGSVSQEMLASGLKISSITTLYGVLIFLIAYLLWFLLDSWRSNSKSD